MESERQQPGDMRGKHWLCRVFYLRFLGCLFFNAFAVAYFQNPGLIGENGLTPATTFIDLLRNRFSSEWDAFLGHPTLFWFIPPTTENLSLFAIAGMALSLVPILQGACNLPIIFSLWILYFSIVNVGQTWYSFGWESQLLETGFLSFFLVPIISFRRFPDLSPVPWAVIIANRWLLFRIMLGAGLIKIRGDECWRNLTCMNYHYQTQPNPNPLSIYFHSTPVWFHKTETLANHFVELVAPFLLLLPWRTMQVLGGLIQIGFQVVIILSGNLAFLNWLTILPGLMSLDDGFWCRFCSRDDIRAAHIAEERYRSLGFRFFWKPEKDTLGMHKSAGKENKVRSAWNTFSVYFRRLASLGLLVIVAAGSYPVVRNLISNRQLMNTSFGAFRLVNSYGAFGSITKVRHEVVLQGTRDAVLSSHTQWQELSFYCKPGDINKTPCWISPYHLRLDWLMWFAAFQSYQQCPWLVHLSYKLLQGDLGVNSLLEYNPFYNATTVAELSSVSGQNVTTSNTASSGHSWYAHWIQAVPPGQTAHVAKIIRQKYAPRFVRAQLYEYQFTPIANASSSHAKDAGWEVGKWYRRKLVGSYLPPLDAKSPSLRDFLRAHRYIS